MYKKEGKTKKNSDFSRLNPLVFNEFNKIIEEFKEKHKLDSYDVIDLLLKEKTEEKPDSIPVCVFDNDKLSCFEAIVKYLKERFSLRFKEISKLLNRSVSGVSTTYYNAVKKMPGAFLIKKSEHFIPTKLIASRKLSVMETIVSYLRESYGLSYHKIALLLRRDDRTIWTVYSRAKKK